MDVALILVTGFVVLFGWVAFRGAPYVPSHRSEVKRAFSELYPVGSNDVVVDLGSGDGRVLREAAGRGARAIGYELNPLLVGISYILGRGSTQQKLADMWTTPLPDDTTLVYVFGVGRDMKKLAQHIQSETNRVNHPIALIVYGHELPHVSVATELRAHRLYRFTALHNREAQV